MSEAATAEPHLVTNEGRIDTGRRIVAAFIDLVIAFVISLIPGIGGIVGVAYMLLRDGMDFDFMPGRSIGKQIMKLRIDRLDGAPMEVGTSVVRNLTLSVAPLASLVLVIPILNIILVPLVLFAAFGLAIVELTLVLASADGRRLGDKFAGTVVSEEPQSDTD